MIHIVQYALLLVQLISLIQAADYTLLNCYRSLPSSFTLSNTYHYQSYSHCYNKCSAAGYSYFALTDHSKCYCGSDDPSGISTVVDTCDAYCFGYGKDMCGGTNSFSVFQIGDAVVKASSSSSSSGSKSVSSSNTSSRSQTTSTLSPATSSTSNPAGTSDSTSATSDNGSVMGETSVIYSTAYHTQDGSTIFVTNTITKIASSGTGTSNSSSTTGSSKSKKTNVGAIVGGVVGGAGGAILVTIIVLFIVRHVNKRREEERMEKEYQEAIKPVEFGSNSVHSKNTIDNLNNNNNNNSDMYSSSASSHRNIQSDNDHGSGNSNGNELAGAEAQDPFDDSRRISKGSLFVGSASVPNKVLTVVNPDEVG